MFNENAVKKVVYIPAIYKDLKSLVRDDSISLRDIDVSKIKNMQNLFYRVKRKDFDGIEDWDVSNVENMHRMFLECETFNKDLSKWDVSRVKNMSRAFQGCYEFEGRGLKKWNVSSVENMNKTFAFTLLKEDLSSWNVSSVKYMGRTFYRCALTNEDFGNWDVSNVENMEEMFRWCETFEGNGLEKWDISNVKNMTGMFYDSAYQDTSLLDTWDTSHVAKKDYMFGKEGPWVKLTCDEYENKDVMDFMGLETPWIRTQEDWDKYCLYMKEHGEWLESRYMLSSGKKFDMNVDMPYTFYDTKIGNEMMIFMHFVLKDANTGEILDDDFKAEPFGFVTGYWQVIPSLEREIRNLSIGDKKNVIIKAKDVYGEYDEMKKIVLPRESFGDMEFEKDMMLTTQIGSKGVYFYVKDFTDSEVTVDFNCPFARKDLLYEVEILVIRQATQEEIEIALHE